MSSLLLQLPLTFYTLPTILKSGGCWAPQRKFCGLSFASDSNPSAQVQNYAFVHVCILHEALSLLIEQWAFLPNRKYPASDTVWQTKWNICLASLRCWPQHHCQFPPCKKIGMVLTSWDDAVVCAGACIACWVALWICTLASRACIRRAFSQPGCSLFVTDRGQRVTGAPWGTPASIYICENKSDEFCVLFWFNGMFQSITLTGLNDLCFQGLRGTFLVLCPALACTMQCICSITIEMNDAWGNSATTNISNIGFTMLV